MGYQIRSNRSFFNFILTVLFLSLVTVKGEVCANLIAGGFNIDIRADLDLLISKIQKLQTITKPSEVTAGNNIRITSGAETQIIGGKISAGNNIEISVDNLNITAAADTVSQQTEEKQAHAIPVA